MVGRLLQATGTALVIAVAAVTPILLTTTATPAFADTVVDGCTIVSNPTSTNFTDCPGADLAGVDLSSYDLSFADFAGGLRWCTFRDLPRRCRLPLCVGDPH